MNDGLGAVETGTVSRARMRTKSAMITLFEMDRTVFCCMSVQSVHLAFASVARRGVLVIYMHRPLVGLFSDFL